MCILKRTQPHWLIIEKWFHEQISANTKSSQDNQTRESKKFVSLFDIATIMHYHTYGILLEMQKLLNANDIDKTQ